MCNKTSLNDKYGEFLIVEKVHDINVEVSIIMSAYNTSEFFLRKSIESILEQTFNNFEFIIVNDGSNILTTKILNEYLDQDQRIKIIEQKNMGITKSLNRAIYLANGKYIARQDTDDIWEKDKLKQQITFLEKNRNIVLIGTQCKILDENLNDISLSFPSHINRLSICSSEDIRSSLTRYNPFCHSSILINKNFLLSVGSYNDKYKYAQDYELWVRVMKKYDAAILPDYLTNKIFHKNSITGGNKRRLQRQLAIKAKGKAIYYFGAPLKYKIIFLFRFVGIFLIPEILIKLVKK